MKKIISGKVVKISGSKTIKIEHISFYKHPRYLKQIQVTRYYLAHDEKESLKVGDSVSIIECRPLSKMKKFMVIYK